MPVGSRYGYDRTEGDIWRPQHKPHTNQFIKKLPHPEKVGKFYWVACTDNPDITQPFETMALAAEFLRSYNRFIYYLDLSERQFPNAVL